MGLANRTRILYPNDLRVGPLGLAVIECYDVVSILSNQTVSGRWATLVSKRILHLVMKEPCSLVHKVLLAHSIASNVSPVWADVWASKNM